MIFLNHEIQTWHLNNNNYACKLFFLWQRSALTFPLPVLPLALFNCYFERIDSVNAIIRLIMQIF